MPRDVPTLVSLIRSRLENPATTEVSNDEIVDWINDTIERMRLATPEWQALEQTERFVYGAHDGRTLPEGLDRIYGLWQLDTAQSDPSKARSEIRQITRRQWIERVNAPEVSRSWSPPSIGGYWYYLWQERLHIVPQPAGDGITCELDYYGAPPDLVYNAAEGAQGTSNFFLRTFFHVIKWGAIAEGHDFFDLEERYAMAETRFTALIERAKALEVARRTGGGKRERGL